MGTEMRIGIAAGLVIVAATSVYFIYGSDRSDGDLLLTPEKTAATTPKASTDKKNPAKSPSVAKRDRKTPGQRPGVSPSRDVRVAGSTTPTRSAPSAASTASRSTGSAAQPRVIPPSSASLARSAPGGASTPIVASAEPSLSTPAGSSAQNAANKSPLVLTKTTDTWTAPGRENTTVPPARMPAVGKVDPAAKPMTGESTAAGIAIAKNDSSATPIARVSDDNASNPAKSDQRPIRVAGRTNASIPPARSDSDANRTANRRTPSAFKPVAVAPASAPEIEIWPKKHTIATGDTLSDISMEYYGTSHRFDLILKANPDIKGPRSLRVGRELIIPRFETSAETSTIVKLSSMNDAPAARSSTARRSSTSPVVVAPKRRYSVQKGDTFYSIARKLYGSTDRWQDLFNANKATVSNPSRLRPGMELVVPN